MPNFNIHYKNRIWFYGSIALSLLLSLGYSTSIAQTCPPNIDFEDGTFSGWTCYTGAVAAVGSQNVISLSASV